MKVLVKDDNPIYSFGHKGFLFGFYGIVQVQEPSVNVTVCDCLENNQTTELESCIQKYTNTVNSKQELNNWVNSISEENIRIAISNAVVFAD